MKLSLSPAELLIATVVIGGIAVAGWQFFGATSDSKRSAGAHVVQRVTLPTLSPRAAVGEAAFDAHCAQCHGKNGSGTDHGPPFLHVIYNPGHHADEAFRRAVRQGVVQHHWPYGNMPPLPQVSDSQVDDIVRYVRELQQANGITYQPHQM